MTGFFQTWIDIVWVTGRTASAALFNTFRLLEKCEIQTTIQSTWIWKGSAGERLLSSLVRKRQAMVCASF